VFPIDPKVERAHPKLPQYASGDPRSPALQLVMSVVAKEFLSDEQTSERD
jgi:hypothetical protein